MKRSKFTDSQIMDALRWVSTGGTEWAILE